MWKYNLVAAKALNSALSMTVPVMVGFLGAHGVTLAQFALLKILFNIAGFIFEIPLGIVSDMMGRKTAMVLSGVLNAASALIYVVGPWTFSWFIVAEVCRAVGMAFLSGTDEALAYEKDPEGYKGFWTRAVQVSTLAEAVFWGTGYYVGKTWGYELLFPAALGFHCLQFLVSAFLPETYVHEFSSFKDEGKKLRELTVNCFWKRGELRALMTRGALIPGVAKVANFLIEPVASSVIRQGQGGASLAVMSTVFSAIYFVGKRAAKPKYLMCYGFVTAMLYIVLGFVGRGLYAGLVIIATLALLQVTLVAVSVGLQPVMDRNYRATISSYRGGLERIVSTLAWILIGWLGIETGSICIGVSLALLLVLSWRKG